MACEYREGPRIETIIPSKINGFDVNCCETNPWFNQLGDISLGLFEGAPAARKQAISHRGFTVGAFGVGLRQTLHNGNYEYKTFRGANNKPYPEGDINVHAEQEIVRDASRSGSKLTSVVLYGDNQPDRKSGVLFPAIVPCSAICLPMLIESPVIDNKLTMFASLSPERKTVMLYTLPELKNAYETHNPDLLYSTTFENEIEVATLHGDEEELCFCDNDECRKFDEEFYRKISNVVLTHLLYNLSS